MKIISFFNNKGGVGKTTTIYHIAWMLSELGSKVLCIDLDPQSNLTSMFLSSERFEAVYSFFIEKEEGSNHFGESDDKTIFKSVKSLMDGDPFEICHYEKINQNLFLVPGNLGLNVFEDRLSDSWLKALDGQKPAFKQTSIFTTIINELNLKEEFDYIFLDIGPNLGALNRAAILSSDYYIIPASPDLFSLQGIRNLGNTIGKWMDGWKDRISKFDGDNSSFSKGNPIPLGYLLLQHTSRSDKPVRAYLNFARRIPNDYSKYILNASSLNIEYSEDRNCLGLLKHYRSLAPMAIEAHKPMFMLKYADGAIGSHLNAVSNCYVDFKNLATKIMERIEEVESINKP